MDCGNRRNISKFRPMSSNGNNYHHTWLRNRELGHKKMHGTEDRILREIYSAIRPIGKWESSSETKTVIPGAVFNLEFSPEGSILVAACEKRNILLFDPISQTYIHGVDNAHGDCVNCIRFLDCRMFATCSDDSTVALWDTRNLKSKIRVLNGHSNWVKNVEYSKSDNLLVTSGFDGSIFTWDINSYTERGLLYTRVFHTNGLMRMRLLPDASKMVICTTSGFMMVIHDLNLETLPVDLHGFKPSMYRLMQISETTIPVAANYTHLFSHRRKRNRIEFVTDFPSEDEAEVISSLQIHPQGWCALSRNITTDERSEWTCVHDIQECDDNQSDSEECETTTTTSSNDNPVLSIRTNLEDRLRSHLPVTYRLYPNVMDYSNSTSDIWEAYVPIFNRERSDTTSFYPSSPNFFSPNGVRIIRVSSGIEDQYLYEEEVNSSSADSSTVESSPSALNEESQPQEDTTAASSSTIRGSNSGAQTIIFVGSRNSSISQANKAKRSKLNPPNQKVHKNRSHLTHFIEETNAGKGYIKELGFSPDGRIICSPYSYGVRLLAFNEMCAEMNTCVPNKTPVRLYEIGSSAAHNDIVLCTKFSPNHCMLASGCHSGNIVWYQPVL